MNSGLPACDIGGERTWPPGLTYSVICGFRPGNAQSLADQMIGYYTPKLPLRSHVRYHFAYPWHSKTRRLVEIGWTSCKVGLVRSIGICRRARTINNIIGYQWLWLMRRHFPFWPGIFACVQVLVWAWRRQAGAADNICVLVYNLYRGDSICKARI